MYSAAQNSCHLFLLQPGRQVRALVWLPTLLNGTGDLFGFALDVCKNEGSSDAKAWHDPVFITGEGQTISFGEWKVTVHDICYIKEYAIFLKGWCFLNNLIYFNGLSCFALKSQGREDETLALQVQHVVWESFVKSSTCSVA